MELEAGLELSSGLDSSPVKDNASFSSQHTPPPLPSMIYHVFGTRPRRPSLGKLREIEAIPRCCCCFRGTSIPTVRFLNSFNNLFQNVNQKMNFLFASLFVVFSAVTAAAQGNKADWQAYKVAYYTGVCVRYTGVSIYIHTCLRLHICIY